MKLWSWENLLTILFSITLLGMLIIGTIYEIPYMVNLPKFYYTFISIMIILLVFIVKDEMKKVYEKQNYTKEKIKFDFVLRLITLITLITLDYFFIGSVYAIASFFSYSIIYVEEEKENE